MKEQRFDELWDLAGVESHAAKLASEYPLWRTRRRRTAGMVAGVALVIAVALPVLMPHRNNNNTYYAKVYCNRTGIADQHWVDLADELLLR